MCKLPCILLFLRVSYYNTTSKCSLTQRKKRQFLSHKHVLHESQSPFRESTLLSTAQVALRKLRAGKNDLNPELLISPGGLVKTHIARLPPWLWFTRIYISSYCASQITPVEDPSPWEPQLWGNSVLLGTEIQFRQEQLQPTEMQAFPDSGWWSGLSSTLSIKVLPRHDWETSATHACSSHCSWRPCVRGMWLSNSDRDSSLRRASHHTYTCFPIVWDSQCTCVSILGLGFLSYPLRYCNYLNVISWHRLQGIIYWEAICKDLWSSSRICFLESTVPKTLGPGFRYLYVK